MINNIKNIKNMQQSGDLKLHLGCGNKDFGEDWIHIDGSDYPHIEWHDITDLPFEDDTVDLIYASHVFEYFDRQEAVDVLKEWRRVLKKGGILRLAVPDFETCAKLYVSGEYPLDRFSSMFYGKWKLSDDLTVYHKTVYDLESLEKVLLDNDFDCVKLWDWRDTCHSQFDDYSQAYLPHMDKENGVLISLNVQAQKP
jgi:predicted SAM-dependent methyltransferase